METTQLTKRECLKMLQGLRVMDNIAQEVEVKLEFKLTYAVAKNVRQLEGIEKDIETGVKKTKIYLEYEKKKMEIAEKHAVRDKNGNAIRRARIINGQQREYFEMPNDPDKIADFESDAKTLDLEYDECIKAREKQIEDSEVELDNLSDFTPHLVNISDVPEQGIGTAAMKGLVYMIDEVPREENKTIEKKKKG